MTPTNSGKTNPIILLVVVFVAFAGFIGTAYYHSLQEFEAIRTEMKQLKGEVKGDVLSLTDQVNKRYLTLLQMAESLSTQQNKLIGVERTIASEREMLAQLQENFRNELAQVRKMGGDANKMVSELEEKFQKETKTGEVRLVRLTDDYNSLKTQIEDHNALLVMMREQALLNQAIKAAAPEAATPAPTPTPGASVMAETSVPMTPASTTAPAAGSSTMSPTNNRVVTDLPGSSGN
jgi:septal ring factor EnvC (AmiA/AmiB activator)